jgi:hypothetical protein
MPVETGKIFYKESFMNNSFKNAVYSALSHWKGGNFSIPQLLANDPLWNSWSLAEQRGHSSVFYRNCAVFRVMPVNRGVYPQQYVPTIPLFVTSAGTKGESPANVHSSADVSLREASIEQLLIEIHKRLLSKIS